MKREQFEHALRAAGAVLGVDEVIVIGSQALHATVDGDLPPEAARSVEVDIALAEDRLASTWPAGSERHEAKACG